mmetsp:Transcript_15229/g.34990  ORF Transcript_15229/g.34990 Transcript_15229/m.34990 type:complete len:288 (+) Transcript_15229:1126-1989(+)
MLISVSGPNCHSPTPLPRSAKARLLSVTVSHERKMHLDSGSPDLSTRVKEVAPSWRVSTISSQLPLISARACFCTEYVNLTRLRSEDVAPSAAPTSPSSAGLRAPMPRSRALPEMPRVTREASGKMSSAEEMSVMSERSSFSSGGSGMLTSPPSEVATRRKSEEHWILPVRTPLGSGLSEILIGSVVSSGLKTHAHSELTVSTCPVLSTTASLTPSPHGWYISSRSSPSWTSYLSSRMHPVLVATARMSFPSHTIACSDPKSVEGCTSPTADSLHSDCLAPPSEVTR